MDECKFQMKEYRNGYVLTDVETDAYEITIPAFYEGKRILRIGEYAFSNQLLLEKITLSEGIEEIAPFAFDGSGFLEELSIPQSVSQIGEYAFMNCSRLQRITIPSGASAMISA